MKFKATKYPLNYMSLLKKVVSAVRLTTDSTRIQDERIGVKHLTRYMQIHKARRRESQGFAAPVNNLALPHPTAP